MIYKFDYQTTPFDLWKLAMWHMYTSIIGMCNILFTATMIGIGIKFWGDMNSFVKIVLIIITNLFTLIQPLAIYKRCKTQIEAIPNNMKIIFDDQGIHINTKIKSSHIEWSKVRGVSKKASMIIVFSTTTYGFILTNKMLGEEKEGFYRYITSKIKA